MSGTATKLSTNSQLLGEANARRATKAPGKEVSQVDENVRLKKISTIWSENAGIKEESMKTGCKKVNNWCTGREQGDYLRL
ncbi:conserved oligomeric golgi complex subunit 6 [Moniliophthora roreri]|nr:conserved oligomeric golgi complex subunit 6 [Moniliophthora roreri]